MKENCVAVVTGGTSGIGREITKRLVRLGVIVVVGKTEEQNPSVSRMKGCSN